MASGEPDTNLPGDRRQYLFKLTQTALDTFKKLLYEAVPLSSGGVGGGETAQMQFHEEGQIKLAAEVAKSDVISEFKRQLPMQSDWISVQVELLETVLDTIAYDHLQENNAIRSAADKTMISHVNDLMAESAEKLQGFQRANPFIETQQLEEHHETIKVNTMEAWNQLDKPGFPRFRKRYQEQLDEKLNELCCTLLQEHLQMLKHVQIKVESEIVETVQKLEAELMVKKEAFDVNMTSEWTSVLEELQSQMEKGFVLGGKNTFPESHPLHDILNEKLAQELTNTLTSVDQLRFEELYPEALRQCLVDYLVKMEERFFGVNYLVEADLMKFHQDAVSGALERWDSLQLKYDGAKYFKLDLVDKITRALDLFQQQMNDINEVSKQQAKLVVRKCKDGYDLRMRRQIQEIHQMNVNQTLDELRNGFPVKSNAHFMALHKKELEEYLSHKLVKYMEILEDRKNGEVPTEIIGSDTDTTAASEDFAIYADILGPEIIETKLFTKIYKEKLEFHRSCIGFEGMHKQLSEILIRAFKKICELEKKTTEESRDLLSNLRAQLLAIKQQEVAEAAKQAEKAKKAAEKAERERLKREQEEKERQEEDAARQVMEECLPVAISSIKYGWLQISVENWINLQLNLQNIQEIWKVYEIAFMNIVEEHKQKRIITHPKIWKEFERQLDGYCKPECLQILNNIFESVETFNKGMKKQFEFRGYFSPEKLDQISQTEHERAMKICVEDEFVVSMVYLAESKIAKMYQERNNVIAKSENDCRNLAISQLTEIYHQQMKRYVQEGPYSPKKLQRVHWKLVEKLLDGFQKACTLHDAANEGVPAAAESFRSALNPLVSSYKETNERKLNMMQAEIKKIAQKMKDEYNVKAENILTKNSDGVETRILTKLHESVRAEVMKLMEIEIKQKVRKDEPLEKHKQVLQCHIDSYWPEILKENHKNIQRKRKRDEMDRRQKEKYGYSDSLFRF